VHALTAKSHAGLHSAYLPWGKHEKTAGRQIDFCRAGSLFFCAECLSWLGTVKHGKAALKYLSFFSFFPDLSGL